MSGIGIILFLPLWLLFSFLIWLKNKGPVYYLQERIGKDGAIFKIRKFRTMTKDAKIETSLARLLRITALDELPQLINILKGEMSFVGPRPLMKKEIGELAQGRIFKQRVKIQPGLTGVAQLLLAKNASLEEKFKYDLWYRNNRSLLMDIGLILASLVVSLLGRWEVGVDKIAILTKLKSKISVQ